MKVHLFGLPISTHRRLKEESGDWTDAVPDPHEFHATPISTNEYMSFTEGELDELARWVSDGFTHLVIPANREWRIIQERFRFDCRVHMARLWEPLKDITWDLLKERLHAATKLDEVWLRKISPNDLRHALLLPPSIFSTMRTTHQYWHKCEVYSEQRIKEAERLLGIVEKEHRRPDGKGKRCWIDARKWRYRIDPLKHGLSTADRAKGGSYRFCYEVPHGFHYDVTEDSGRPFTVPIDGEPQRLTHCNVTPWGHVRV